MALKKELQFLHSFFLGKIGRLKMGNYSFYNIKTWLKEIAKFASFQRGSSIVFAKNFKLHHSSFKAKIDRTTMFGEVLDIKLTILDYKKLNWRKSQNSHFCRGLVHCFCKNCNQVYAFFLFSKNRPNKRVWWRSR